MPSHPDRVRRNYDNDFCSHDWPNVEGFPLESWYCGKCGLSYCEYVKDKAFLQNIINKVGNRSLSNF